MLSDSDRIARLQDPAHPAELIIDTDTANEIDDQFALAWALLSRDELTLTALYAAPFVNKNAARPDEGMYKSYAEIETVLDLLGVTDVPACRGSETYLPALDRPVSSPAAEDLVARCLARPPEAPPLYVATIGCLTNIASALLLEPAIAERMVILLLAGNPHRWPTAREFNLQQDIPAGQVILTSGAPILHVPAMQVAQSLGITYPEVERYVKGRGRLGEYLAQLYEAEADLSPGHRRVLWDLAPIAWLLEPAWAPAGYAPMPTLTDEGYWSPNFFGPVQRVVEYLNVSAIYGDFFSKLARL